jgi:gliding motility-associated-like protein
LNKQINLFVNPAASSYTWSGPNAFTSNAQNPTIATASLVNAGNYTVTVTNASGCTNSAVVNVVINPLPVVVVNSPTICVGSTFTLTAITGTAFAWTGPTAYSSALQNPPFASAQSSLSGNYTVLVTSAQGCTNTGVANVLVVGLPTVSIAGTNTLCSQNFNGSPNTTTLTASGATTFTWTLPAGFSGSPNLNTTPLVVTPPVSAAQTVVQVTVNGSAGSCTSQAVYNLTVYPNPTITATSGSMCAGTQVTLTANNATTYTWSPATALSTTLGPVVIANPAATTVYSIIGSSNGGYNSQTQTSTVTVVPNPTVTINPNPVLICLNSSINLTASGATTYTWSPNIALTTTLGANTTASPTITTTYSIIGSQATCTNLATIQVSVIGLPTVSIAGTNTMCSQNFNSSPNTTTLTASGAATYVWTLPGGFSGSPSLSSNPLVITPPVTSVPIVATMTVLGTAGSCTSQAVYQVTVYPNPTITATSGSMCAGTQVTLTANNATTYTWSPSATLNTPTGPIVIANPAATTVYSIVGSSNGGCNSQTQTSTVTVVPNPTVTINPNPALICLGSSVNLAAVGATTYTWSPNIALTTTVGANTTASPTITTTYSIIGSQATCTNLATIQVSVIGLATVSIAGTNTLCSQNFNASPNTTTLTASGAGTYVWSLPPGFSALPNTSSNPITVTPPVTSTSLVATFTVLGTAGSCTSQAVYQVTVYPNPTITATSGSLCAGTSVTLTASNATTYTWSPSATLKTANGSSVIASPAVTTVYSIIGGSVGCNSQTQNATASVVPNPTVTILPNPALICLNSSINLTASGATTYTWSPNIALTTTVGANTTASPTITTTYSIIGSQATCTNLATIQVSVIGLPTVAVVGTNTLCSQNFNGSPNTTTLTASGAGTYVWTLPAGFSGSPSLSSNPLVITPPVTSVPMVATMTVLGTAGTCTNQAVYTITVIPNPTISATSGSMCVGTSVTLTASNATTYTWSPSATLNTANGSSVIASPAVTTVYSIIGGSVGCNSQTQNATASVVPNPTVTILPNPAVICLNQSINLTASGANNYTWTPNIALTTTLGSNTTANPLVTTTYSVIGEAATCTHVANITVSVLPLPTITIVPSSPTMCMNNFNGSPNTVSLTANGAGSYTWGPIIGLTTNTLNGSMIIGTSNGNNAPTGTVIGANGTCTNSATFTLSVIDNPIIATTSGSMCAGTSVSLTAANAQTYTWSPSATLNTANGPVVIASPTVTTVYSVIGGSVGCNSQAQNAIATVVNNPTVSIAPNTPTICFGNSINLTGNGATNYTWSPNTAITATTGANVTVNPTVTTTYQLIGEAATCTHVTLQTVTVVPLPIITIALNSPTMCMNNYNGSANQITVTASGGTSYNWTGFNGIGNNTNSGPSVIVTAIPNIPLGTGTVIGTVGTCTNVASFSVIAAPNPIISVPSVSVCQGKSVMLTASGAQTYQWSPPTNLSSVFGSTVMANPNNTTVYSVIGSSINCQSPTETTTVTVVANPVIVIAPVTPTICAGSPIGLTAFGATNYTWSPAVSINTLNGNFVVVNPTVTMNYIVMGEAATCTSIAVRQVSVIPLPDLQATASKTLICVGDKVNLIGNGATSYTWMPTTGLNTGSGNLVVATPMSNITYTIVGTNGICTTSVTLSIGVAPRPILNLMTTNKKICKGASAMIIVSGCDGYYWHPTSDSTILASNTTTNTTSMVVTPTANMNYTITGFNSSGPAACPFTKEILVEVVPTITAQASWNSGVCEGESIKLEAEGSNTYQWVPYEGLSNPNTRTPYASPKVTTVYTVIVSDMGNCPQTATTMVKVNPQPTVDAGPDMTYNSDEQMFLNAKGTGTITWTFGENIICKVCPNSQITPTRSGVYYATTTNEFGCSATDEVWIEVTNDYPIFVPNSFTPNYDGLNDVFLVYGEGILKFEMSIYNRWNQKIFNSNDQKSGWDGVFKGEIVKNDSYLYIINYTTYDNKKRQKTGYVVVLKEDY